MDNFSYKTGYQLFWLSKNTLKMFPDLTPVVTSWLRVKIVVCTQLSKALVDVRDKQTERQVQYVAL